ncbi:hypothetical protein CC1G_13600 [Coprinopsis cinerea okayama7|uniref:Uncharacterized protein n=1 Tax=Coprinopsis cinerea (strain Okayama-7 / 130 / ATCC MYA-4618 / FGSC 9003) TaxID=240176 RepID=D6RJU7_COPC7|nr:hypothetical protein CC1G_13600 [Coprinopsis cinerea okayama7\|eukprot:XP_002912067.1 hypothetical protein CC1G_13600 [Coprinopsis cinerea okayama7\
MLKLVFASRLETVRQRATFTGRDERVGDLPSPSLHQIPSWREQNHRRGVPFHSSSLSKAILETIEKKSNGRIGGRGCTWFKNRRKASSADGVYEEWTCCRTVITKAISQSFSSTS